MTDYNHGASPSEGRIWLLMEAMKGYFKSSSDLAQVNLVEVYRGDFPQLTLYPNISITPSTELPEPQPGMGGWDDMSVLVDVKVRVVDADPEVAEKNAVWMIECVKNIARNSHGWNGNALATTIEGTAYDERTIEEGTYLNEATVTLRVRLTEADFWAETSALGFPMNLPFIINEDYEVLADHGMFYDAATQTYHQYNLVWETAASGPCPGFPHYKSTDGRSWEYVGFITVTGAPGTWNGWGAWAPHPISNTNYGVAGADLSDYKYLMFYTGISGGSSGPQRIGLLVSNDLDNWDHANSGNYIYDPSGTSWAQWQPESAWWANCRDPFVFYNTDSGSWFFIFTAASGIGWSRYGCLGLAKFPGGDTPQWLSPASEPSPIVIFSDDNQPEASCLFEKDGTWHYFKGSTAGTKHLSSPDSMFGPSGTGWNNNYNTGNSIATGGLAATEVTSGPWGNRYLLSNHKDAGTYYEYYYRYADFDTMVSSIYGYYPTIGETWGIWGMVAKSGGTSTWSLTWGFGSAGGTSDAFFYQPIWGDQGTGNTLDGNGWINTRFKHYQPYLTGSFASGTEWTDYTRTGWISTSNWTLGKSRMKLSVGGGNHPSGEFVALVDADNSRILFKETGNDSHSMTERTWDTTPLYGRSVYLVIADQVTGDWGCIAVDNIREVDSTESGTLPTVSGDLISDYVS